MNNIDSSSHQAVEHGQFREFIPPLLSPKSLSALVHLHQLLHRALMKINAQVQERERCLTTHLHRR